jgi:hypothetical protein
MAQLTTRRSIEAESLKITLQCDEPNFVSLSNIPDAVVYSAATVLNKAAFEAMLFDENLGAIKATANLDPGNPDPMESLLEISETEIGFLQFLKLEEFTARYAGATSNAGAITLKPFKTLPTTFPDSGGPRKPWMKPREQRHFQIRKANSSYVSNDQPSWMLPHSLPNSIRNGAKNFLQSWRWKFKILSCLVRHSVACNSDGGGPKLILASSVWTFDFDCTFKWVNGKIAFDKKLLERKLAEFVFDPPKNNDFQSIYSLLGGENILSESFLLNRDFNNVANENVKKAIRISTDSGREEQQIWMETVPADFYTDKK